ncbi:hypothetical protein ACG02S_07855 [Roseateles sp. DC23W]|uniref:Uncharacterized protein n=1 Tax=Pelomonas dachongensis TaxID=3299029 RepID=A0ABW7EMD7_9BURK
MFPGISIKSDFDKLASWAQGLPEDQVPFATALTLTRTGQDVKTEIDSELPVAFDQPTPYTRAGFRLYPATKTNLRALVTFREDARHFLNAQVAGGDRRMKALERALQALKALPPGMLAVPGEGARLDRHGNVDRGQVVQVLSQLRITLTSGYSRNMSHNARSQINAQRRAGGRFFVPKPGSKLRPGVYQRELTGNNITPVFIFVRAASYKVRLPVGDIARSVIEQRLPGNFATAWQQAMATARRR